MELIIKSVVLPPVDLCGAYCSLVKDWLKKQMEVSHSQPILTNLRDTLLPKLLSGELRIPDAEKLVAETV
jgi:type I restriction enzyme S subunit